MRWIRSLFGRKRASTTCTTDASTHEMAKEQPESPYLSDDPIRSKTQDRFGRAPFAARIAETIAKRADPSSIVIGLFGPWGDGKTSVLKMMEESLGPHQNAIAIRFNPWHFPSEEALLRGFFATLAETLGKEPGFKGRAAELLGKYGGLLSAVSVALPGVDINPGEAAKNLGEALSKVGLDELKDEIDALLLESGKRLVILVWCRCALCSGEGAGVWDVVIHQPVGAGLPQREHPTPPHSVDKESSGQDRRLIAR